MDKETFPLLGAVLFKYGHRDTPTVGCCAVSIWTQRHSHGWGAAWMSCKLAVLDPKAKVPMKPTGRHMCTNSLSGSRTEANPTDTLILDFSPPELGCNGTCYVSYLKLISLHLLTKTHTATQKNSQGK